MKKILWEDYTLGLRICSTSSGDLVEYFSCKDEFGNLHWIKSSEVTRGSTTGALLDEVLELRESLARERGAP